MTNLDILEEKEIFYEPKSMSDLIIIANKSIYHVHKQILAKSSQWFLKILQDNN